MTGSSGLDVKEHIIIIYRLKAKEKKIRSLSVWSSFSMIKLGSITQLNLAVEYDKLTIFVQSI